MKNQEYIIKVNNPQEDPFVYYEDKNGRIKGKIELVKSGFWGRKGRVKLNAKSLKFRHNQTELTIDEFILVLKRIIENFESHDLIIELT